MPYITPEKRNEVDGSNVIAHFTQVLKQSNWDEGVFNYIVSSVLQEWLDNNKTCYRELSKLLGVLDSIKLEFYRRKISNYEDRKIKENGDVYKE